MIQFKMHPKLPLGGMKPPSGGGLIGTLIRIVLFILMIPILIIGTVLGIIWMIYMRWKLKKQFKNMASSMKDMGIDLGNMGMYMGGTEQAEDDEPATKKVDVKVIDPEE